ncbi:MAG TPA: metal-dependent transcriptional regulator [Acidimicrobiales bacterium]|jgi:DtxR family Mn-dependent transcriptional regulator|nr:metal-dependent transcriptional regulator [Acidimicrobiales bacterium]
MESPLSKSERETLKAIYRLNSGQRGGAPPGDFAHTGDLAERLGVSPGTVTSIVKRLADRGLVDYTPYRGVELTVFGRQQAVSVIRRHRIVERFLSDVLGYAWNEADRLAPSFEHELPQEVEDRLFVALNCPSTCPHGFPIPDPEGTEIPAMPPLYALEPGDVAVVAMSGSTDREMVTFLDTLGLRPGVEVEVKEKHPFDGPLVLRVDGHDRTLGERLARQIFVRTSRSARPEDDHSYEHRKEQVL